MWRTNNSVTKTYFDSKKCAYFNDFPKNSVFFVENREWKKQWQRQRRRNEAMISFYTIWLMTAASSKLNYLKSFFTVIGWQFGEEETVFIHFFLVWLNDELLFLFFGENKKCKLWLFLVKMPFGHIMYIVMSLIHKTGWKNAVVHNSNCHDLMIRNNFYFSTRW